MSASLPETMGWDGTEASAVDCPDCLGYGTVPVVDHDWRVCELLYVECPHEQRDALCPTCNGDGIQ